MTESKINTILRAMREVVDEMSADRERYVGGFRANWDCTLHNAEAFAETMLREPRVAFTDEAQKALLLPYEPLTLMIMARLMDHLEYDEEDWLRETGAKLQAAWQKLVAAIPVFHPQLVPTCTHAYESFLIVQQEVLGLFLGDLPPELTPRYGSAFQALKTDLASIAKEVSK